jgi:ACS family hexuronate transporter-like MFS transporter
VKKPSQKPHQSGKCNARPQIKNVWGAVPLIAIACACHQGWSASMFTLISDIFPKRTVASVKGLAGFSGAIGRALSASFIGLILNNSGSYYAIFAIASIVYLFSQSLKMV